MVTVKNRCLGFQWHTLCKSVMTEKKVCYYRKKGYLQKVLFHDFQNIDQPIGIGCTSDRTIKGDSYTVFYLSQHKTKLAKYSSL